MTGSSPARGGERAAVIGVEAQRRLSEVAAEALNAVAEGLPSGAEAEIYLSRGSERGVDLKEGRVETIQESWDAGMGLRVIQGGRLGFASAAGLGLEDLRRLLRQALEQIPFSAPDPYRTLPSRPEPGQAVRGLSETLNDASLFIDSLEAQLPRLLAMEKAALGGDSKVHRVLHSGYGESRHEVAIFNTRGLSTCESVTHCSVGLAVIAESPGQVQVGGGSDSSCFYSDLDFERAARDAAFRAGALLDAKKMPTARRQILFDPWAAGEFLDLVAGALSSEQVQRGKSLFRGKMGSRVANPLVHLVDDPHRPRATGSTAFDDEGVPTRRKVMVEAGILKEFFYDTYTAGKDARSSNGSAGRPSYRGTPSPSPSNFFMEPGRSTREKIIADTKDGLLVLEVMGMHTADPISGEFSVGVSGIAVEGGRLTHGVRGAMLAGNMLELLDRVDAVADDLTFYGQIAAPTFRVADMMVA